MKEAYRVPAHRLTYWIRILSAYRSTVGTINVIDPRALHVAVPRGKQGASLEKRKVKSGMKSRRHNQKQTDEYRRSQEKAGSRR